MGAVESLSYAAFEARLAASAARKRVPISGQLELTYRCNFECVHCYEQDVREQPELDGDTWCRIIDQAADAGCLWLTLTGGEALLHPEFERIYERAVRRGLLVTVFSNGSLLTERVDRLFRRLPPRSIEVTLYGFSAETYARSTRRPKGFQLALDGIRRMHAAGHEVQVKTVVFRETAADLEAIRSFAKELGVQFRYDTNVHGGLDGGSSPRVHRLSPGEIVAIETADPQVVENLRKHLDGKPGTDRVYRCGAGRYAYNVAPDGYLQLCTLVRSLRFDLRHTPFSEAWAALEQETERRYQSANRRCSGCSLQKVCGTCPGVAELNAGDAEAAIDEICETTHLRASAILGRPVVPSWKREPKPGKLQVLQERADERAQGCSGGACAGCTARTV